jgi:transposase
MGNPRGVKRDFDALEARRLRAARLFQQGKSQAEIARVLRVHRQTVHRWAKQVEGEGQAALRKAGRAGRKPRLSAAELRRLAQELKRGPEVLGYETSLWTAPRVADLIERECGIRYHPGHVWKILRQMGWSGRRGEHWSGTRQAFGAGRSSAGRSLKKSRKRGANHRLHR